MATTWEQDPWGAMPQFMRLQAFQRRLAGKHPQAGRDFQETQQPGRGAGFQPCWLDLSTLTYPRGYAYGWNPRGPESHSGNPAIRAIREAYLEMEDDESETPGAELVAEALTGFLRDQILREPQTPPGLFHPQSHRSMAGLMQHAALYSLETWMLRAAQGMTSRKDELEFNHALWLCCRVPQMYREALKDGGIPPSEMSVRMDITLHQQESEKRAAALREELVRHLAGMHPDAGWSPESRLTTEHTREQEFREGLQAFLAERLKADDGRILPSDKMRLARVIAREALGQESGGEPDPGSPELEALAMELAEPLQLISETPPVRFHAEAPPRRTTPGWAVPCEIENVDRS